MLKKITRVLFILLISLKACAAANQRTKPVPFINTSRPPLPPAVASPHVLSPPSSAHSPQLSPPPLCLPRPLRAPGILLSPTTPGVGVEMGQFSDRRASPPAADVLPENVVPANLEPFKEVKVWRGADEQGYEDSVFFSEKAENNKTLKLLTYDRTGLTMYRLSRISNAQRIGSFIALACLPVSIIGTRHLQRNKTIHSDTAAWAQGFICSIIICVLIPKLYERWLSQKRLASENQKVIIALILQELHNTTPYTRIEVTDYHPRDESRDQ